MTDQISYWVAASSPAFAWFFIRAWRTISVFHFLNFYIQWKSISLLFHGYLFNFVFQSHFQSCVLLLSRFMKFEDAYNCFIKFHVSQQKNCSYKMNIALARTNRVKTFLALDPDLNFDWFSDLSFEEKNLTSALQVYWLCYSWVLNSY